MQTNDEIMHRLSGLQYYIACGVVRVCSPYHTARLRGDIVASSGMTLSLNDIFTLNVEDWQSVEMQWSMLMEKQEPYLDEAARRTK